MNEDEMLERIAFAKDSEAWFRRAERKFEERIELMNAIMEGKMGTEEMTYSDMIIMELRTMEMLVRKYANEGNHCVLGDWASLYYN